MSLYQRCIRSPNSSMSPFAEQAGKSDVRPEPGDHSFSLCSRLSRRRAAFFRARPGLKYINMALLAAYLFQLTALPCAARAEESIVVLSIRERGEAAAPRHSPRWTRFMEQFLDSIGQRVAGSADLTMMERVSVDPDSLEEQRAKLQGSLILWGEIQEIPDRQQRVKLFLYDIDKHVQQADSDIAAHGQIELVLEQLVQRLLAQHFQPAPRVATQKDTGPPGVASLFRAVEPPKLPVWRKRLAASMGVLGSCVLIAAVLTTVYTPPPLSSTCPYPNSSVAACETTVESQRALFGSGYALAALLGISAAVTVIAPWRN